MMPAEIRVCQSATPALSDWLHDTAPLPGIPDSRDVACLWLTLCNGTLVTSTRRIRGAKARVVVLQQTGQEDVPSRLWPVLLHFCALTLSREPGVTLILTGNAVHQRERMWTQHLSLFTPGLPPVKRLMIRQLLRALLQITPAVAPLLRRLRVRRHPHADS